MDEWSEEDEFMPTVQEVAKTLATMRSRQQDNDHVQEVGFARFNEQPFPAVGLNIPQQATHGQALQTTKAGG